MAKTGSYCEPVNNWGCGMSFRDTPLCHRTVTHAKIRPLHQQEALSSSTGCEELRLVHFKFDRQTVCPVTVCSEGPLPLQRLSVGSYSDDYAYKIKSRAFVKHSNSIPFHPLPLPLSPCPPVCAFTFKWRVSRLFYT